MYTHPTFESFGTFILMRPIFYSLLAASIALFVLIVWPSLRRRLLNTFAVLSISALTFWVSVQTMYYDAIIVDEIELGGDPVTTYMVLLIVALSFMNPLFYLIITLKSKPI
ncbi:hypothetical protein [Planomicrobium sp. Y74]|uniref:hypothetical protein n=1 Tax=Planomicrobium sp. Y74 TaxID=2478977 RepID=UPI000EF4A75A|nr:hypothetical protein [Planomicrobium sp. Y74]RLQ91276.1 hypothetical protein D9754_05990 [Planomicrobium sp. Y74]